MVTCSECKQRVEAHVTGSFCSRECSKAYYARYRGSNRKRVRLHTKKYRGKPEVRKVTHHYMAHTSVQKYLQDVSDPPTCKRCGGSVPIRPYGSRWSTYCSEKCKRGGWVADRSKCRWCQSDYTRVREDHAYCSHQCRSEAHHFRKTPWRPSPVSECQWCGFGFLGEGMFCGGECERHARAACVSVRWAYRAAALAQRARVLNKSCQQCGATFPEPKVAAYCDRACQKRAYRKTDAYKKGKAKWRINWRKRNPEKRREQRKALKDKRRHQGRREGHRPTTSYRNRLVNPLTTQTCFYCGDDCTGDFHWDHFIPLAKGGPEAPWNLVVSCPTCNLSKSDKLPESVFCDELGLVT